jgi:hypothetical protein
MSESPRRQREPEIIPPGAPLPRDPRAWTPNATYRVRTVRIGPLGTALLALGIGAAAVLSLIVLLGAALIGATALSILIIGAVIASLLRGPPRPLR